MGKLKLDDNKLREVVSNLNVGLVKKIDVDDDDEQGYGSACDMWSLGIVLTVMYFNFFKYFKVKRKSAICR